MITIPDYRPLSELTDDEIAGLMRCIYPSMGVDDKSASYVSEITHIRGGFVNIKCKVAEMYGGEAIEWNEETFVLGSNGRFADGTAVTEEEKLAMEQYLFACGCHYLLDNNPFL